MTALTFTQMEIVAKNIHPDASPVLNEHTSTWNIVIPTAYLESYELDEKFKGTPAWEAHETPDTGGYGSELLRWEHKNGRSYGTSNIHDTAVAYNEQQEAQAQQVETANSILEKYNLRPVEDLTQEEMDNMSKETRSHYMEAFKALGW